MGAHHPMIAAQPDESAIRAALARVLASDAFASTARLRMFLDFIVTEMLGKRGERLKATTIAEAVYSKDVVHDPGSDALVRAEATRLRRVLRLYYESEGIRDRVRLTLPTGSYLPKVEWAAAGQANTKPPTLWNMTIIAAALCGITLVLAVISDVLLDRLNAPGTPPPPYQAPGSADSGAPTIVVLPFQATPAAVLPGFGTGLADQIATELSRFEIGTVYAPLTGGADPAKILAPGSQLLRAGTRYALTGTIGEDAGALHISVHLLDISQGRRIVWAHTYQPNFTAGGLSGIETELARDIAVTLGYPYGVISSRERALAGTANVGLSAYACVLGVDAFLRNMDDSLLSGLTVCLKRAVREHPSYAGAWAGLSIVNSMTFVARYLPPVEAGRRLDAGLDEANRAVGIDPENAFARVALAFAHLRRGELVLAKEAAGQAAALNPNDPQILVGVARIYYRLGERDLALRTMKAAPTIDSIPPAWFYITIASEEYRKGRYTQTLEYTSQISASNIRTLALRLMAFAKLKDRTGLADAAAKIAGLDPHFADHLGYFLHFWGFDPVMGDDLRSALQTAGHTPLQSRL